MTVPVEGDEEEAGLHGITNLEEAKRHTCNLDAVLAKIEESIRQGVAENIDEENNQTIQECNH